MRFCSPVVGPVVFAVILQFSAIAQADSVVELWDIDDAACAPEDSVVDSAGNLYVGCHSMYDREWRVTAYDSNGLLSAVRAFNGLDNALTPVGAYVSPTGLALDESAGRLYVSGQIANGVEHEQRGAMVAFSLPDLAIDWVALFSKDATLGAVTVGGDGSVYVLGGLNNGTDSDLLMARVSPAGLITWQFTYDSGDSDAGSTSFERIEVDSGGNAYGVGNNVVVKVSPDGEQLWQVTRPAISLALQDDRYLVVTTPLVPHGQTALFDLEGNLLWEVAVGGHYLATADHGDVWTARSEFVGSVDVDWEIYRISDAGQVRWAYTFGLSRQDMVRGITIDAEDNAYVTGQSQIRAGLFNMFWATRTTTIKLSPQAEQLWRVDYAQTTSPAGIHLATDQTVYVVGLTAHVAYEQTEAEETHCQWWEFWCR